MENTFGINIIPENEKARLKALHRYNLIKDLPAGYFDKLAEIMIKVFDTPIALISLVDEENVPFAGNIGMPETKQVPRGTSLCSWAILIDQPTIFPDAL